MHAFFAEVTLTHTFSGASPLRSVMLGYLCPRRTQAYGQVFVLFSRIACVGKRHASGAGLYNREQSRNMLIIVVAENLMLHNVQVSEQNALFEHLLFIG